MELSQFLAFTFPAIRAREQGKPISCDLNNNPRDRKMWKIIFCVIHYRIETWCFARSSARSQSTGSRFNDKTHFSKKLSDHLCGYRKGYTSQYALLKLIENWKKFRDERGYSAAVLMDLSKAFDTINHELLIANVTCIWFTWKMSEIIKGLSNK